MLKLIRGSANACQILGRALYELHKEIPFSLCSLNGGLKDNAIPRQAEAVIVCPENGSLKSILRLLRFPLK